MSIVSSLRVHAHNCKVEAAAWLEGGCDQSDGPPLVDVIISQMDHAWCVDHPCELNMSKTRCTPAFCQDYQVCGLRKFSLFCLHLLRTSQQPLFAATGQQLTCS